MPFTTDVHSLAGTALYYYTAHPTAVVYGRVKRVYGLPLGVIDLMWDQAVEVGIAREGPCIVAYADFGKRAGRTHFGHYSWARVPVYTQRCGAAAREAVDILAEELARKWLECFRAEPWVDEDYPSMATLIEDVDVWPPTLREGVTDAEIEAAACFAPRARDMLAPALRELLGKRDELAKIDAEFYD